MIRILIGALVIITTTVIPFGAVAQTLPCPWTPQNSTHKKSDELLAIIERIPPGTSWHKLSAQDRARLQQIANARLNQFRAEWNEASLVAKLNILESCPTPAMLQAINDYYRKSYPGDFGVGFDVNAEEYKRIRGALLRNYLGSIAYLRGSAMYSDKPLPDRDWDGVSRYSEISLLPDTEVLKAIREFHKPIIRALQNELANEADEKRKTVLNSLLYDARARAVDGGLLGASYSQFMCRMNDAHYKIYKAYEKEKTRPPLFNSDNDVLVEANSLYLNNALLRWVDIGTYQATQKYELCAATVVDDAIAGNVGKGITLFHKWWSERLASEPSITKKCTIYSASERNEMWEAFSSASKFNNLNDVKIERFSSLVEQFKERKVPLYRRYVEEALKGLFPDDSVLTVSQRKFVLDAVHADTAFGTFFIRIPSLLDRAQNANNGVAATSWKQAVAQHIMFIGGENPQNAVRVEDEIAIRKLYSDIKTWLSRRYQGYPINVGRALETARLEVAYTNNAVVNGDKMLMTIGIKTSRSLIEHISTIIHEFRHVVWRAMKRDNQGILPVVEDEGPVIEGSGAAVEELLVADFMKDYVLNDVARALYALQYAIKEARFAGTTDATLQTLFRKSCDGDSEPNTIEFTKRIAIGYGLTGILAENASVRSHVGTQYFQYLWNGESVLDDIEFLQMKIDPTRQRRVDPFVLFACRLNNPRRDEKYVSDLKHCMKV